MVAYNPFMPSYPHIEQYRTKLQELIEFGGSDNEIVLKNLSESVVSDNLPVCVTHQASRVGHATHKSGALCRWALVPHSRAIT